MAWGELRIRLPDWVYGFIEVGWKRHNAIVEGLSLTNIFPFVELRCFDSFEEYAGAVIEGLVRAYYESFMKKQREGLKSVDETILSRADKMKKGTSKENET